MIEALRPHAVKLSLRFNALYAEYYYDLAYSYYQNGKGNLAKTKEVIETAVGYCEASDSSYDVKARVLILRSLLAKSTSGMKQEIDKPAWEIKNERRRR
jgi:hypothetical protein